MHDDAVARIKFGNQLINREIAFLVDSPFEPVPYGGELPMIAAMALALGRKRTGLAFQLHHVIDELDRHAKVRGRSTVRVALINKVNNSPTKLNRMWFAHI